MEELLGFSIIDAIYYTRYFMDSIEPRLEAQLEDVAKWCPSLLDFSQQAIDITADAVWVSEETLVEWCDGTSRFHNFIDRLSIEPGSVSNFSSPFDINPLERAPFIKSGDEYLLPLPGTLPYALANTFYYDFMDSDNEGDFRAQFGDWLEEWAIDCLSKIYPSEEIISNYTYECDGQEVEGDILILTPDNPVVIECKGKKLRAETRKGHFGGVESVMEDIESGIGNAHHQVDRLVDGVQSGDIDHIVTSDGSYVDLEPESLEDALRWIVLGESYGTIATQDFVHILNISPVPYVCDIYDLQILSEALKTSAQISHYVRQRINQTKLQLRREKYQLPCSDEIDYLGVYVDNGYEFPAGQTAINGAGDRLREDTIDDIVTNGEFQFWY